MLQGLFKEKLIDAVAMDIKTSLEKYGILGVDMTTVLRSISLIVRSGIDYKFRTTVDGELCTEEDVSKIVKLIAGTEKYTVQKAQKLGTGNIEAARDDDVEMTSKVLSNRLS
jgi:pyruvate formate lyase activating enzyme